MSIKTKGNFFIVICHNFIKENYISKLTVNELLKKKKIIKAQNRRPKGIKCAGKSVTSHPPLFFLYLSCFLALFKKLSISLLLNIFRIHGDNPFEKKIFLQESA